MGNKRPTKTGYFEHWEREHLGDTSKQSVFSKTIESYNKSIEQGNYPLGFLISSSLLEDRIKSLWVIVEWYRRTKSLFPTKKPIELKEIIPLLEVELQPLELRAFIYDEKNPEIPEHMVYRVKPTPSEVINTSLKKMLHLISEEGFISKTEMDRTLYILEEKSILTNLSMWNTHRYNQEVCEKFFKYFRRYDTHIRKTKELLRNKK
jgi:hypothetical protein